MHNVTKARQVMPHNTSTLNQKILLQSNYHDHFLMMSSIFVQHITDFLDELTQSPILPDYPQAYNGLQISTDKPIQGIAAAVDASFENIQQAVACGAHYLLVHHGLFWQKPYPFIGKNFKKYQFLFEQGCAIYSCHLPLDSHMTFGNNALIAQALKADIVGRFGIYQNLPIGVEAKWHQPRSALNQQLRHIFPHMIALEFGPENIETLAISSGSGTGLIADLSAHKISTLITGELRQHDFVIAQEQGLNLYACGHYATETFGVKELGKIVSEKFQLPFHFISSTCPL